MAACTCSDGHGLTPHPNNHSAVRQHWIPDNRQRAHQLLAARHPAQSERTTAVPQKPAGFSSTAWADKHRSKKAAAANELYSRIPLPEPHSPNSKADCSSRAKRRQRSMAITWAAASAITTTSQSGTRPAQENDFYLPTGPNIAPAVQIAFSEHHYSFFGADSSFNPPPPIIPQSHNPTLSQSSPPNPATVLMLFLGHQQVLPIWRFKSGLLTQDRFT